MDSLQQLRDERLIEQHHKIHKQMQKYLQALEQRYQREFRVLEATKNETKRYIQRCSYKLGQELVQIQDQMDRKRLLRQKHNGSNNIKTEYPRTHTNSKIHRNINNSTYGNNTRVNYLATEMNSNNNSYKNMSRLRETPMTTPHGSMNHGRYLNFPNSRTLARDNGIRKRECYRYIHGNRNNININGNRMSRASNSWNSNLKMNQYPLHSGASNGNGNIKTNRTNSTNSSVDHVSIQNQSSSADVSSTCKLVHVVVKRRRRISNKTSKSSNNDSVNSIGTNNTGTQKEMSLQESTNQNNDNGNINNNQLSAVSSRISSKKTARVATGKIENHHNHEINTQNNKICNKTKQMSSININTSKKIKTIKNNPNKDKKNNKNEDANKDESENIVNSRVSPMDHADCDYDNSSEIEPDCDSVVNDSGFDGSDHDNESDNSKHKLKGDSLKPSSKPSSTTKPTRHKFNSRKTPYQCYNCKKYYANPGTLQKHIRYKICLNSDDNQFSENSDSDNDSDGSKNESTISNSQSNSTCTRTHDHSESTSKSKSKSRMNCSSQYYVATIDMNSVPDGKYPCRYPGCGARFKSSISLGHHKKDARHQLHSYSRDINKMNDVDLPFPCGMCSKRFGDNRHLIKHIESKHTTVNKSKSSMLKCHKCHRGFDKKNSLKMHLYHSNKNGKCSLETKKSKKKRAKSMGNV